VINAGFGYGCAGDAVCRFVKFVGVGPDGWERLFPITNALIRATNSMYASVLAARRRLACGRLRGLADLKLLKIHRNFLPI
jgi:hypothetical protein